MYNKLKAARVPYIKIMQRLHGLVYFAHVTPDNPLLENVPLWLFFISFLANGF